MIIIKRCEICGKQKDITINIFLNGITSDNRKKNMITSCVNCSRVFKQKRMFEAVKVLHGMGLKFGKRYRWYYNDRVVRSDMFDLESMERQIKNLKQEVKDLKYLLGIKKENGN